MFSFWTGRKYSNRVAEYLGVNAALFSSALLEAGVTWYHLKVMKKCGVTVHQAAEKLLPAFKDGLAIVENRFGQQSLIKDAQEKIAEFEKMLVGQTSSHQVHDSYSLRVFVEDQHQMIRGKPLVRQVGDTIVDTNLEALKLLATPPAEMKDQFFCEITNDQTNEVVFRSR